MKKILKQIIFIVIIFIFSFYARGQNLSTTIKVQAMDMATALMKNDFATFIKYMHPNIGEIITYKDQLQAVLPESTTLKTPLGELTAETSMIVISPDNGKNWWFIDTNVYRADKLKNILPDLSPQLIIPPQKKPKLVPTDNKE